MLAESEPPLTYPLTSNSRFFKSGLQNVNALIGLLAFFYFWLLSHPYSGLWHDARLYAGQALHHLYPEIFKRDLFFQFGSQDDYSIFGRFYAFIIDKYGLANGVAATTLLSNILWFSASVYLLRSLTQGTTFWLALLMLCVLPGNYGNNFSFGESFVTARIFSESAVLVAIAFAIVNRGVAAALLLIMAIMIHPLMSIPALLLLIIYRYGIKNLLMIWAPAGIILLAILIYLQVYPFVNIAQQMDPTWYAITMQRAPYLALHNWEARHWTLPLLSISIVVSCWLLSHQELKRLFASVLLTTILCLALAWVGGSWLNNSFLVQLQLWRTLWLTQWFATFGFAWLIFICWENFEPARIAITLFICTYLLYFLDISALVLPIFAVALFWNMRCGKLGKISKLSCRFVQTLLLCLGMLLIAQQYIFISKHLRFQQHGEMLKGIKIESLFFHSGFGIFIVTLFFLAKRINLDKAKKWLQLAALSVLMVSFPGLLNRWQIRNDLNFPYRTIRSAGEKEIMEIQKIIPKDAVVYWEGGNAAYPWFLLNRASYISEMQTAGTVFHRKTAIEGARRAQNIRLLSMRDSVLSSYKFSDDKLVSDIMNTITYPTAEAIFKVCGDPVLSFVVLSGLPVEKMGYVAKYMNVTDGKNYYFYECRSLRMQ